MEDEDAAWARVEVWAVVPGPEGDGAWVEVPALEEDVGWDEARVAGAARVPRGPACARSAGSAWPMRRERRVTR